MKFIPPEPNIFRQEMILLQASPISPGLNAAWPTKMYLGLGALRGIYHLIAVFNHFRRTPAERPLLRGSHLSWFPHSTARRTGWMVVREGVAWATVHQTRGTAPVFLRGKIVSEVISTVS